MRKLLPAIFILVILSSCVEFDHTFDKLPEGIWRGELSLVPYQGPEGARRDAALSTRAENQEGKLPFLFEVISPAPDSVYIEIINGKERIRLTDLSFGRNSQTARDTVRINFPIYGTYITADIEGGNMDGFWYVPSRKDYKIPFSARFGKDYRFTTAKKKPVMNVSGRWATVFDQGEDAFDAIGVFEQHDNTLTGTFMTETGDFRFLEGTVQGDRLMLSTFDGSHAFLFEAKINPKDSTMNGAFYSGKHYKTTWTAHYDPQARLANPEQIVKVKSPALPVQLNLTREDGSPLDLNAPPLAGKPKIIQIMGTWCPNCRDEGNFLVEYFSKHKDLPVQVIGLAFEKTDDKGEAYKRIRRYKQRLNIPYEIIFAGQPKKENVLALFPQLDGFSAYPTLIFLDANNKITRVHTGFSGPATPEYGPFKKEFEQFIEEWVQKPAHQGG